MRRRAVAIRPAPTLDRAVSMPLSYQLYDQLRQEILGGQLRPGERLPSTRGLASQLGIARNTVSLAYMQLWAEGLLESKRGCGTWVAGPIQEAVSTSQTPLRTGLPRPVAPTRRESRPLSSASAPLSRRSEMLAQLPPFRATAHSPLDQDQAGAFRAGLPALDAFPQRVWAQVVAQCVRRAPRGLLAYQDDTGYRPLREAIASHLGVTRGVRCTPEQVIVVAGAQAALDLAARVLLDPGDVACIEEPGSVGARGALLGAGAQLIPVPVDGEGLNVAAAAAATPRYPQPRLVYVTPFHQVPTGVTMSLARRLALVQWAKQTGAWILEDGYGSDLRLSGRPLPTIQGLEDEGRVLYFGTFGKALFPALLVGYAVVPDTLIDAFATASRVASPQVPALIQAALADFMLDGHFTRHIGRMLQLYRRRQAALVDGLRRAFGERLDLEIPQCGIQLFAWLPPGLDDRMAARAAAAKGVEVALLSRFCLEPPRRGGLVLGYAAFDEEAIEEGSGRLSAALESLLSS